MDNKVLLSGYLFENDTPCLLIDTIFADVPQRKKILLRNTTCTLRMHTETYCTGSYNLETLTFQMCPHKATVIPPETLCAACKRMSGFNPAFYNAKTISPQQEVYNIRPHVVYLANFGINQTKVGIAHRVPKRWYEQGARVATVVKHCENAYQARDIEAQTSKLLKIPEVMNPALKRRLLTLPFDISLAKKEIEKVREDMTNTLHISLETNDIVSLDTIYLQDNSISPETIDLTKTNTHISGTFVGMVGDTLIMEQNNQQYMLSIKKFISHLITLEETLIPNREQAPQMAFDF
jgi:hypothetical protein